MFVCSRTSRLWAPHSVHSVLLLVVLVAVTVPVSTDPQRSQLSNRRWYDNDNDDWDSERPADRRDQSEDYPLENFEDDTYLSEQSEQIHRPGYDGGWYENACDHWYNKKPVNERPVVPAIPKVALFLVKEEVTWYISYIFSASNTSGLESMSGVSRMAATPSTSSIDRSQISGQIYSLGFMHLLGMTSEDEICNRVFFVNVSLNCPSPRFHFTHLLVSIRYPTQLTKSKSSDNFISLSTLVTYPNAWTKSRRS